MSTYVVETFDLCKTYKHTMVVDHLNMKIKQGEIYGFIGRNGAGKSTTLKMLCGLVTPSEGSFRLFQEDEVLAYQKRRIGALVEQVGLYPNLNAQDHMELKATGIGLHDPSKIQEILTLVHLDQAKKKPIKTFSLGMKQRLGIALALLGNPDLLILDEPINGLDPEGIRELRDIIQSLNKEKGMTIIISSHILEELSKIATCYGMIKDGVLIEQLSREELESKCRSHITLILDDLTKACALIEQKLLVKDYEVHDQAIWIYDDITTEAVMNVFMKEGIKISQIYKEKQSLESYFLHQIGGDDHAEYH